MLKMTNVSYETSSKKAILKNISLDIQKNEFVSIIGSNGAGKSTLLKLITNAIQPSSGRLKRGYSENDVGCVLQDYKASTFDTLTIKENLQIACYKKQASLLKSLPTINFEYWLKKLNLGLEHKLNEHMSSLSGGQRQAISIIMSMITNPKLLLLDEHTSALDPVTAKPLMDISYKLCKENSITTLMVTHDLNHAAEYSDRILVIEDGEIKYDLTIIPKASELLEFLKPVDV